MQVIDGVQIGLTVVSLMGAGYSWWREHLSQKAKADAEESAKRARMQADGVQDIAKSLRVPNFEILYVARDDETNSDVLQFRNNTSKPVKVELITGDEHFILLSPRLPRQVETAMNFSYDLAQGGEVHSEIVFRIDGSRHVLPVPGPSTPR